MPSASKQVPSATSPCHAGGVTLVELDRMLGCVITGGEDGYLSLWEYAALEAADMLPDGKAGCPGFQPLARVQLTPSSRIRALQREGEPSDTHVAWIVLDGAGAAWRVTAELTCAEGRGVRDGLTAAAAAAAGAAQGGVALSSRVKANAGALAAVAFHQPQRIFAGHAGAILAAAPAPACTPAGESSSVAPQPPPILATAGLDGSVRAWDVGTGSMALVARFALDEGAARAARAAWKEANGTAPPPRSHPVSLAPLAPTASAWAPALSTAPSTASRILALGFSDGTVRLLLRGCTAWVRLATYKPHSGAGGGVVALAWGGAGEQSSNGGTGEVAGDDVLLLCSAGGDGAVFFAECSGRHGDAVAAECARAPLDALPEGIKGAAGLKITPLGFLSLTGGSGGGGGGGGGAGGGCCCTQNHP